MGCVEGAIRVLGERKICMCTKKQKVQAQCIAVYTYNGGELDRGTWEEVGPDGRALKGLSHEMDFKNFDKNLQNLA